MSTSSNPVVAAIEQELAKTAAYRAALEDVKATAEFWQSNDYQLRGARAQANAANLSGGTSTCG